MRIGFGNALHFEALLSRHLEYAASFLSQPIGTVPPAQGL
jgi:hypothetical protein